MDENVKWFYEKRAAAAIEALGKNRMGGTYVADLSEVSKTVLPMIPAGASVGFGGSMTIFETGLYEALCQGNYKLLDRYEKGISPEEMGSRQRQALLSDVFVAGVNAVTEQGELVFVDASCTRVGPILFGPKKVILITGCNKIVPNLAYAQERIRHFVAPANAKRLNRKTPCAQTGQCMDCDSPDRICNATVVIHKQANPKRLHVVFVGESLGL